MPQEIQHSIYLNEVGPLENDLRLYLKIPVLKVS